MAERYPIVRAGKRVTGAFLESFQPQFVRKTADTARTSGTGADPELQFEVEANAVYEMRGMVYCSGTASTDDINIDFSAPSGTDGTWSGHGMSNDALPDGSGGTVGTVAPKLLGTGITSGRSFGTGTGGASAPAAIAITATIIVGSTAGTYSLDWNRLGGSGTVTVYQDSFMMFTRVA
jgi:hypothetical protein